MSKTAAWLIDPLTLQHKLLLVSCLLILAAMPALNLCWQQQQRWPLTLTLGGWLLAGWLGGGVWRSLRQELGQLAGTTNALSGRDFSRRVHLARHDAIGGAAASVDALARRYSSMFVVAWLPSAWCRV